MFKLHKSIDIDFAHHVSGHTGACINIHGHTWKFEVVIGAHELDETGFVVDFKQLKHRVLEPVHRLLDHSLALSAELFTKIKPNIASVGEALLATRASGLHSPETMLELQGARNVYPGGMKMAIFPFTPTSERIAQWLYLLADSQIGDSRVMVIEARVYETLHPVEAVASYVPTM